MGRCYPLSSQCWGGAQSRNPCSLHSLLLAVMKLLRSQPSRNEQGEDGGNVHARALSPQPTHARAKAPHCPPPHIPLWGTGLGAVDAGHPLVEPTCSSLLPTRALLHEPPMRMHSPGWVRVLTHPLSLHTHFAHPLTHARMGITSCTALSRALATSPAHTTGDGKS